MIGSRRRALMATLAVAVVLPGCAGKTVRAGGQSQQVLVVLLPDADTGKVGKVVVSNPAGQTELATAYASTRITTTRAPQIRVLKENDVMKQFSDVIATLPPPPLHFTLYFRFDSEELTAESRALVQDVLKSVKAQPVPDVVVIGHTDTTGNRQGNFELGMRRANAVRTLLIDAGLTASAIDTRSHGELELLVPTGDETFEPKNRRVEITVR